MVSLVRGEGFISSAMVMIDDARKADKSSSGMLTSLKP